MLERGGSLGRWDTRLVKHPLGACGKRRGMGGACCNLPVQTPFYCLVHGHMGIWACWHGGGVVHTGCCVSSEGSGWHVVVFPIRCVCQPVPHPRGGADWDPRLGHGQYVAEPHPRPPASPRGLLHHRHRRARGTNPPPLPPSIPPPTDPSAHANTQARSY